MNVNDYPSVDAVPESDQLQFIFMTQRNLADKYDTIEVTNGFHSVGIPVDLHDKHGQAHLKDMAWRVTEEIGEALEAVDTHKSYGHIHVHEELADGLHFIVELCIKAGMGYERLNAMFIERNKHLFEDTFDSVAPIKAFSHSYHELTGPTRSEGNPLTSVSIVVKELGKAMNCLKNKPWKQTHQLTDVPRFELQIYKSLIAYLCMMRDFGLEDQEIFNIYFRKSKVNEFRQKSHY